MDGLILVTGGTGDIGRRVVRMLTAAGRHVRVLSRKGGAASPGVTHVIGDTVRATALDAAFSGAPIVLHLAGGPRGDDIAATNVVEAARAAHTRHLLLISVVGAGEVPLGYVRRKAAAEAAIEASGIPWTVLRAAQLHSLLFPVVTQAARLPFVVDPRGVRMEPVDGDVVARRLAELAQGDPAGRVRDIAGPEVLSFGDLIAAFDAKRGRDRRRLSFAVPGAAGRAYRAGANLADAAADRGGPNWEEFLARQA